MRPTSERATTNPNTLNKGGIYPQGTGWVYEKAHLVTFECYDQEGNLLTKAYQAAVDGKPYTATAPAIENHSIVAYEATGTTQAPTFDNVAENKSIKVTYERSAYNVIYRCVTTDGKCIKEIKYPCAIGSTHTITRPKVEFFDFENLVFKRDVETRTIKNGNTELKVDVTEIGTVISVYQNIP